MGDVAGPPGGVEPPQFVHPGRAMSGRSEEGIHTMMRALRGAVLAAATAAAVVLVAAGPAAAAMLPNGDFEAGNLSSWTAAGSATVTTSGPHAGSFAAALGLTPTPTNGDSSIAQTFTVPAGSTQLSFWYNVTCPDTVTFDWATATLRDDTAGVSTTPLARTCTINQGWKQVTAAVTAGHS